MNTKCIPRRRGRQEGERSRGLSRSHTSIENLLLFAHFEGNHVVSLLPSDAEALRSASPTWADRARRALDHADENHAQIAGLRAEIAWSIELGLGEGFGGKAHNALDSPKVIRASLHAFERSHTVSCAALLGENATDADFFRELGLLKRAERRWDAVEMVHDARGGGGSTIAPEYERLAATGHIVLAVADADMRHPSGGEGGTYALSDVVRWMKTKKSKRALAARFALSGNAPLAELAEEVLAWGLALPPILTHLIPPRERNHRRRRA